QAQPTALTALLQTAVDVISGFFSQGDGHGGFI
ncbi:MAG: hypothetical protein RLZZ539_958, partial [Pseudomonadota bacterium]